MESTLDLTIILDCGIVDTPVQAMYIEQVYDQTPIFIGSCTYSELGQYYPSLSAMNHMSSDNQSIQIDVESPLSAFKVDVEDHANIDQLTSIKLRALEPISYAGVFTLTIISSFNDKNQTKIENVEFSEANNFSKKLHVNITTYGKQILHVRGGEPPNVREDQAIFTIGTDIKSKPQVYIINQIGIVHEDFIYVDIQWINGIGFDIQINYGNEKQVTIRYGHIVSNLLNRIININDGTHQIEWKRIANQRIQVGYK